MLGKTHMTGGSLAGLLVIGVTQPSLPVATAIISATTIGSLLPDCDTTQSKIAYANPIFKILCGFIHGLFGHRGFTHSLIACPLFGMLGFIVTEFCGNLINTLFNATGMPWDLPVGHYAYIIGVGFMIGALSHEAYDIFNKEGCPLLYPCKKRISIMPITTGSMLEHVFCGVSIVANLLLLYILYRQGIFTQMIM